MNYKNNYLNDIRFIGFIYKKAFEISKTFWIFILISSLSRTVSSLLWVFIPKYIIDELMGNKRIEVALLYILIFVLSLLVFGIISNFIDNKIEIINEKIDHHLRKELSLKIMKIDYEKLEDSKTLDLKDRASEGINFWGGIRGINSIIIEVFSTILSIGTLITLIIQLNYLFAILLFLIVISKTLLNNKLRIIVLYFWDKLGIFNRQFRYLVNLMMDYRFGKDIRLFNMSDLILNKAEGYKQSTLEYYIKQGKLEKKFLYTQNFISFIQNLTIYGFTVYYAYSGVIGIGSLVLYLSASTSIISSSTRATQNIIDLKRICQYGSPYMAFINLPNTKNGCNNPIPNCDEYIIELNNVSFKYPRSNQYVLKNISFRINHQEKISIVGLNGAGKTTLIKLLLRLYEPTEGEILINGVNIKNYSYDEYLNLFSVVFQDFRLLSSSIKENITCNDANELDESKIWEALKKVNLTEKCESLSKKLDTQLFKNFYDDGIELSGGQNQKMAIARAIYKNANFVILDEPTANLDPIAEYEIFSNFDSLVSNKTTVYISHRLSTCRLSDKILVINEGEIVEYGNHNELINQKGLYKEMWDKQAKYYINI